MVATSLISLIATLGFGFAARANEHAAASTAAEHGAAPHGAAPAADAGGLTDRAAPVSGRDVKVPRALIERIESEYALAVKKPVAHGAKPESIKRGLLNVAIEFDQAERAGALVERARFLMAPGGGPFDFEAVVATHRAAFNVKVVPRDEAGASVAPSRVYFVPAIKSRRIDGEVIGDGCGKFMELTSAFRERFLKRGFDVYTADQRYLSTLGGTFIFARFDQSALQVASVTFNDSRYPQLSCE